MAGRGPVARFFIGAACVGRALKLVGKHRSLWAWIAVPAFGSFIASCALVYFGYRHGSAFVAAHVAGHGSLVAALSWVLFWIALLGVCLVGFLATSAIVTAPLSGFISERTERIVTGAIVRAPTTLGQSVRGLGYTMFLAVLYLASEGTLVALELVAEPLAPLWIALGFACSVLFLAYDHLDAPLSRLGTSTDGKWAYIHSHLAEVLGFGTAATLLAAVPGLGLAAPAIAATGGTLLCLELREGDQSSAIAPS